MFNCCRPVWLVCAKGCSLSFVFAEFQILHVSPAKPIYNSRKSSQNCGKKVQPFFFFPPFVLSLESLAHRGLCLEAFASRTQTRAPGTTRPPARVPEGSVGRPSGNSTPRWLRPASQESAPGAWSLAERSRENSAGPATRPRGLNQPGAQPAGRGCAAEPLAPAFGSVREEATRGQEDSFVGPRLEKVGDKQV